MDAHTVSRRPGAGFALIYSLLLLLALSLAVLTVAESVKAESMRRQAALWRLKEHVSLLSVLHGSLHTLQPARKRMDRPRSWAVEREDLVYQLTVRADAQLLDLNAVDDDDLRAWFRSVPSVERLIAGRPYAGLADLPLEPDELMGVGLCGLAFNTGAKRLLPDSVVPKPGAGPNGETWVQAQGGGSQVMWIAAMPQHTSHKALTAEVLWTQRSDYPFQVLRFEVVDSRWIACRTSTGASFPASTP